VIASADNLATATLERHCLLRTRQQHLQKTYLYFLPSTPPVLTLSILSTQPLSTTFKAIFSCIAKMSFLGGAECSTAANPLSQFTKHVQNDNTLQRDRLVGRGPGGVEESMRSSVAPNGSDQVHTVPTTSQHPWLTNPDAQRLHATICPWATALCYGRAPTQSTTASNSENTLAGSMGGRV
jgi:hypothetical protein